MKAMMDICQQAPVIPVLSIEDVNLAVPLAKTLVAGGLPVLEVTLRTDVALKAIEMIARECPEAIVGAGTLRNATNVTDVINAGAQFGVSPGSPDALIEAVLEQDFPFLPGCATATEAMRLVDIGFDVLKLFPAEALGGIDLLKSLGGPFPQMRFCPTGGVSQATMGQYLALPNVVSVGGSWLAPKSLVTTADWQAITAIAAETVTLAGKRD